jgi:phosphoribosylanthranilate isomerase
MSAPRIEIKICGLTTPAMAIACVAAGADSIGMVFHPSSPRNLLPAQAREIAANLPPGVAKVGVFVHQSADEIVRIAAQAGLNCVQFHGDPMPSLYEALTGQGLHVVQKLCGTEKRLLTQARLLPPGVGVIVECGRGALPGGNGTPWNWGEAHVLQDERPFAVAGGLDAANIREALAISGASAVDISSGVEAAPGVKDLGKVTAFIAAVRASGAVSRGQVFHVAARSLPTHAGVLHTSAKRPHDPAPSTFHRPQSTGQTLQPRDR